MPSQSSDLCFALRELANRDATIDPNAILDHIYDSMVYLMRYTKGGISHRDVIEMDRWQIKRWQKAVERLLKAENSSGKSQGENDDGSDDAGDENE